MRSSPPRAHGLLRGRTVQGATELDKPRPTNPRFWGFVECLSIGPLLGIYAWERGSRPDAYVLIICLTLSYLILIKAALRPVSIVDHHPSFANGRLLFLIFCYILFFLPYQEYVLGGSELSISRFVPLTFESQSNRAIVLATAAILAFDATYELAAQSTRRRLGATVAIRPGWADNTRSQSSIGGVVLVLQVITMGAYLRLGLRSANEGRYTDTTHGGATADGISILILTLCMASIGLVATRRAEERASIAANLSALVSVLWTLRLLALGDRNSVLLIVLVAVIGYSSHRVLIGRVVLSAALLLGLAGYNTIEDARTQSSYTHTSLTESLLHPAPLVEPPSSGSDSSFNITTIGLRASLAVVPAQQGYGYGAYKVLGILGIVPFAAGYLLGDDPKFKTSESVITGAVLGPNPSWSIGSNVISDLYVDYGALGVLIGFALLSWALARLEHRRTLDDAVATRLYYVIFVALIAELPRYTIDFPFRVLLWTTVILLLSKLGIKNQATGHRPFADDAMVSGGAS